MCCEGRATAPSPALSHSLTAQPAGLTSRPHPHLVVDSTVAFEARQQGRITHDSARSPGCHLMPPSLCQTAANMATTLEGWQPTCQTDTVPIMEAGSYKCIGPPQDALLLPSTGAPEWQVGMPASPTTAMQPSSSSTHPKLCVLCLGWKCPPPPPPPPRDMHVCTPNLHGTHVLPSNAYFYSWLSESLRQHGMGYYVEWGMLC